MTAAGGCISVPVSIKMDRSKWRRSLLLLATLVFSLCLPAAARAHSTIQGLEGFSAGALHPLTTPAHLLVITAPRFVKVAITESVSSSPRSDSLSDSDRHSISKLRSSFSSHV